MKKLYLILLMLLILFIPTSINAVAVYQLDQPVKELDNHTLREVFENRNMAMPDLTGKTEISTEVYRLYNANGIIIDYNTINGNWVLNGITSSIFVIDLSLFNDVGLLTGSMIIVSGSYSDVSSSGWRFGGNLDGAERIYFIGAQGYTKTYDKILDISNVRFSFAQGVTFDNFIFKLQLERGSTVTPYQVPTDGPYSNIDVGQFNLTSQQIEKYYDLYLEAVRFEQENTEASQDIGGYQNIFRSILDGVKSLMTEMAGVWEFLNAPIITSDMQDYSFNIDWSWDIIGVLRQLIGSLAILILQTNFLFINLLFSFTGIPIQISILSMIFSNFVFVILGWIIVKSFII